MLALYRKYRPQKITDLDLANIREQLTKTLSSGKITHAYVFVGPRGTGKTSAARIVAKAINCQQYYKGERGKGKGEKKFGEPCNKCDSCRSITDGSALDLLEIDAASNRGIDEVRDLREKIKLAPARLHYKVYIIDEVHMLTTEAFNALLKTLEEPPSHAVFILATTEPQKLPATILSRCMRLDFRKASSEEMKRSLARVIKGENLSLSDELLDLVIGASDGSFRDATKILDQLASQGGRITRKMVEEMIAHVSNEDVVKFIEQLILKNSKEGLLQLDSIVEAGGSMTDFARSVLEYLHKLLLVKSGAAEALPTGDNLAFAKMQKQADLLTGGDLTRLINLFTQAAWQIRFSPVVQLPLELAVVEYCNRQQEIKDEREEIRVKKEDQQIESQETEQTRDEPSEQILASAPIPILSGPIRSGSANLGIFQEKWPEILKAIKPYNHSVEALLRSCRPKHFDGKILLIETFYTFHRDKVEQEKVRNLIEKVIGEITGISAKVKTILGSKPLKKKDVENIMETGDDDDMVKAVKEIFS